MKLFYTIFSILAFSAALMAQPGTNATDPDTRDAVNVLSIYGDTYNSLTDVNYDPNWGQSGHMLVDPAFDPGTGNVILAYPSFNYQGTDFNGVSLDASQMEFLHVDIWVPTGTDRLVKISPIDNSGAGAGEVLVSIPLNPGSWSSVDLPKSMFGDMSWTSVIQMKFDGQFNGDGSANVTPYDIYIDNLYFWKEPTQVGTDATLSDLQLDGVTIPGFASGKTAYNFSVSDGGNIPQITSAMTTDATASTVITQAQAVPGDATVVVTSGNGVETETYTVSFSVGAPGDSPADPTISAADVVAFYSDVYNTITGINYDPGWGQSGHTLVNPEFDPGTGNFALAYPNFTYQGMDFIDNAQNLSAMDFLHVDVWVPVGTDRRLKVTPIDDSGIGATEVLVSLPLTPGSWNSVDLPKSAFADMSWENVIQIKFDGQFNGDDSANTSPYNVYVDNIYFWKDGGTVQTVPETAAPTPSISQDLVISLFSDAYDDVNVDTWRTDWSESSLEDVLIENNPTKKYTNLGFNGIETINEPVDASEMKYFYMDIWSPNMDEIKVKLVDFLGDGFGGDNEDTEAELVRSVTKGEWMTLMIELADFQAAGMTSVSDINQIVISSVPFGTGTLYVDNVFFSVDPVSTDDEIGLERINIYPNPIANGNYLTISEKVTEVSIMTIDGKVLQSSTEDKLYIDNIESGMYLVQLRGLNGQFAIKKLMVK